MLAWEEKLNLGNGKYIVMDAKITDTQRLMLVQNYVHRENPLYVEYCEQDAQAKRFYLTSTKIEEAKKEAEEVIMKYLFNEARAGLKRYNRFKEAVFNENS